MTRKPILGRRSLAAFLLVMIGLSGAIGAWRWSQRPSPLESTEIFPGITYSCQAVNDPEARGLAHLLTIDLSAPGLELFVTPLDPAAVAANWEYATRWPDSTAVEQRLSVMVNGTLYETRRSPALLPGGWARSLETIVSEHQINHVDPNTYLLWFEDDLTPHLEKSKPPSPEACRRARWAVGGQGVLVDKGKVSTFAGRELDARTLAGIDPERGLLFLTVFDAASEAAAARFAVEHGVKDAIVLDGGDSTCLWIGQQARGVASGTMVRPHRALATVFGVRAPDSAQPAKTTASEKHSNSSRHR